MSQQAVIQKAPKVMSVWLFILGTLFTLGVTISAGMYIGQNYFWVDPVVLQAKAEIGYLQDKVAKNPKDLDTKVALGYRQFLVKDYTAAITTFKSVLDVDKKHFDAYLNLGYVYFAMKQYDLALENFEKCTKLGPSDYKGWLNAGITYYTMGKFKQSFKALDNARYINRTSSDILYHYGMAYELSGNTKEAIASYEEALQYNPSFEEAKAAIKKLTKEAK